MNKQSLTIGGVFVTFFCWLFLQLGIDIGAEQLQIFLDVIAAFGQLAGLIMAYIGRYRKGDITLFGKKK